MEKKLTRAAINKAVETGDVFFLTRYFYSVTFTDYSTIRLQRTGSSALSREIRRDLKYSYYDAEKGYYAFDALYRSDNFEEIELTVIVHEAPEVAEGGK